MRLLFSGWRHPTISSTSITASKSPLVKQGSSPHFGQPQTALPFWWGFAAVVICRVLEELLGWWCRCFHFFEDRPKSAEEINPGLLFYLKVVCARFDFAQVFLSCTLSQPIFIWPFLSRCLRKSRSRFRWWASWKGRDHRILIACSSNFRAFFALGMSMLKNFFWNACCIRIADFETQTRVTSVFAVCGRLHAFDGWIDNYE